MMALEWSDVDLDKRQLCVQRSEWKGHVTVPKGGRLRYVPLTTRLAMVFRADRHLTGARVLCSADGSPLTQREVQGLVARAARGKSAPHRSTRVATHVLIASVDACFGARDSRARRPSRARHDAALHAPQPGHS